MKLKTVLAEVSDSKYEIIAMNEEEAVADFHVDYCRKEPDLHVGILHWIDCKVKLPDEVLNAHVENISIGNHGIEFRVSL